MSKNENKSLIEINADRYKEEYEKTMEELKKEQSVHDSVLEKNLHLKQEIALNSPKKAVSLTLPSFIIERKEQITENALCSNFSEFVSRIISLPNIEQLLLNPELFEKLAWSLRQAKIRSSTVVNKKMECKETEITKYKPYYCIDIINEFGLACDSVAKSLVTKEKED